MRVGDCDEKREIIPEKLQWEKSEFDKKRQHSPEIVRKEGNIPKEHYKCSAILTKNIKMCQIRVGSVILTKSVNICKKYEKGKNTSEKRDESRVFLTK